MTKAVIRMTIDDAEHHSPEERAAIVASYPEHEREARAKGIPMLGSGRVFPLAESQIIIEPIQIPSHWVIMGALDFGWDHPTAAVKGAWDRDADVVYLTHEYRVKKKPVFHHAAALKGWGKELPWVWPHDGLQHDKQSGKTLAESYEEAGLEMMAERVEFEGGGFGVEAGIMEMMDRFETGRLKIFNTMTMWLEEFRMYHRKDGQIVKEFDDLMSASRYWIMGKRFAETNTRTVIPKEKRDWMY